MVVELESRGVAVAELQDYVCKWIAPRAFDGKCVNANEIFTAENWRASKGNEEMRRSASEVLSVYAILTRWVSQIIVPLGWAPHMCASFRLLCAVLDLLRALPSGSVSAEDERAAIAFERQAVGRLWRRGQHRTVNIWRFVASNTIEEKLSKSREKAIQAFLVT